jgi:hypothetical protein
MKEFLELLAEGMLLAGIILLTFTFLVPQLLLRRKNMSLRVLRRDDLLDAVDLIRLAICGAFAGTAVVGIIGISSIIGVGMGAGAGIFAKRLMTMRIER